MVMGMVTMVMGRVTVVMEEGSHSNGEGWGLPW